MNGKPGSIAARSLGGSFWSGTFRRTESLATFARCGPIVARPMVARSAAVVFKQPCYRGTHTMNSRILTAIVISAVSCACGALPESKYAALIVRRSEQPPDLAGYDGSTSRGTWRRRVCSRSTYRRRPPPGGPMHTYRTGIADYDLVVSNYTTANLGARLRWTTSKCSCVQAGHSFPCMPQTTRSRNGRRTTR